MSDSTSCMGCKWLFTRDTGYSNYTVIDTEAHCVHGRNPNLPADIPDELSTYTHAGGWNWILMPSNDRWYATRASRCSLYEFSEAKPHHIDCEGNDIVSLAEGRRIMTEEADPMPLLIAQYINEGESK